MVAFGVKPFAEARESKKPTLIKRGRQSMVVAEALNFHEEARLRANRPLPFRVVATMSSKGGTGKSTVAHLLAHALHSRGARVGLLDADIDSPYVVEAAGVEGKITLGEDRRMVPVVRGGMPWMSFALWHPDRFGGASMHGSMHTRWITDALRHTKWGDLDVLVYDAPAGTGDEALVLKEVVGSALLGLVVVGLPNVVSGVHRVYNVASAHGFRILGVIENLSGDLFGSGGVREYAESKGLHFYGSMPADARVRVAAQRGDPSLVPPEVSAPVDAAATHILGGLSLRLRVGAKGAWSS